MRKGVLGGGGEDGGGAKITERKTANAKVATVLGSIPASSYIAESEGRQMKQC